MDTHSCERVYRTKTNIIHMELIKTIRMSATMKRNNQQALYILVGGLEHFLFFHVLGRIIPNDFHIFQRGRLNHQPVSYDVRWNEQASRGPPIGSMYAIYGNIYHQYTPNVSIYTIHGSYGISVSRYAWGEVSIDGDLTFGEIHTLIDTSIKKPLYRNLHIEMENLAMDNQL